MNLRFFSVVLGSAVGLVALAACTTSETTGSGGAGSGTGGGSSASTAASGGGSASSTAGVGGAGGGGACATCNDVITNGADPNTLCAGPAADAYDALATCTCDATNGKCATQCGDNACMGMDPSADCVTCLQDPQGCQTEISDCGSN